MLCTLLPKEGNAKSAADILHWLGDHHLPALHPHAAERGLHGCMGKCRFSFGLKRVVLGCVEAGADFEHADFLAPGSPPGRPGPGNTMGLGLPNSRIENQFFLSKLSSLDQNSKRWRSRQKAEGVGRCSFWIFVLSGWSWDWRPDDDRFVEARLGLIALLNSTWAGTGEMWQFWATELDMS